LSESGGLKWFLVNIGNNGGRNYERIKHTPLKKMNNKYFKNKEKSKCKNI